MEDRGKDQVGIEGSFMDDDGDDDDDDDAVAVAVVFAVLFAIAFAPTSDTMLFVGIPN